MFNLFFMPNLSNPHAVLGVIHMISHDNLYRAIDIVNRFLRLQKNDIVYRYFIEIIAHHCKASPLKFLSILFDSVTRENKKLIINVINNKTVIKAIKSAYLNSNHFDKEAVVIIARKIQGLMNQENVLKILQGKVFEPIFVTFGYHPVIASDIELQKKWIKIIAEEPLYAVREIPWYITDEALEVAVKTDLKKVITLIDEFFGDEYFEKEKVALFSKDMLKKIITLYAVSESSTRGQRLLSKINRYSEKGLLLKP